MPYATTLRYSIDLPPCPYCSVSAEDAWVLTDYVLAMPHPEPLASCHVVVAPRRHVATFYDMDVQEQRMLWDLVEEIRKRIAVSLKVEGFDIGFSDAPPGDDGSAHAHVHVLPRIPGESIELPAEVQWVDINSQ